MKYQVTALSTTETTNARFVYLVMTFMQVEY